MVNRDVEVGKNVIIRSFESKDIDSVVEIHLLAFPNFFLSFLGQRFLRQYYKSIVDYSQFGLVAAHNGKVIGFTTGLDSSFSFYRRILKSRGVKFALAAIPAIVKQPTIIFRLAEAIWKRSPREHDAVPTVHLTSIGVMPEMVGKSVGHLLMREFSSLALQKGFQRIVLETDAENNMRACQFYSKEGFQVRRSFVTTQGRKMYEFEKKLQGSEPNMSEMPSVMTDVCIP